MEEVEKGATSTESIISESNDSDNACSLKTKSTLESIVNVENPEPENKILTNGQNGHLSTGEEVSNGHDHCGMNSNLENVVNDEVQPSHESDEKNEAKTSTEIESEGNGCLPDVSSEKDDYQVNDSEFAKKNNKENSIESDRVSSSSSSTFTSNKEYLNSSSDDVRETNYKAENSEDDNYIDVDRISSNGDDKSSVAITEEEEEANVEVEVTKKEERLPEVKRVDLPSRVPKSVSSPSSYKTAYGSMGRISGRRPVTVRGRKRKAEEEVPDQGSPSQASPRWRFFKSSVSNLWPTPSSELFSSPTSSFNNIDDSMTVNVNEESIGCHLNDTDLFLETKDTPPSKKSKWGCIIM